MQRERSTESLPIPVTRTGVIVAEGYGLRLYARRGVLHVDDRDDSGPRRAQLVRASSRGRRIVLLGRAGSLSVEALKWMADNEVGFCLIDASAGRVVVSTDPVGTDVPQLRRLQATASMEPTATQVARPLIVAKVAGQLDVVKRRFADADAASVLRVARERADVARTVQELLAAEAAAANT